MKLQEQIGNDMVIAMRTKNVETLSLLRVLIGEFSRIGKDLTDDEVLREIRKMSENAKSLGNETEVKILDVYLPTMLDVDQLTVIISGIIDQNGYSGMKDMGKVMSEIKTLNVASQIDGKLASDIVKSLLK